MGLAEKLSDLARQKKREEEEGIEEEEEDVQDELPPQPQRFQAERFADCSTVDHTGCILYLS